MRQSAQTLRDRSIRDQGTCPWPVPTRAARPASISFRSARLTWGISSGRLRNHGQKATHQAKPRTATSTTGDFQLPMAVKSQTRISGASAPPSRLDIQMVPWAEPRSVVGIQSAVIREIDGKVPA